MIFHKMNANSRCDENVETWYRQESAYLEKMIKERDECVEIFDNQNIYLNLLDNLGNKDQITEEDQAIIEAQSITESKTQLNKNVDLTKLFNNGISILMFILNFICIYSYNFKSTFLYIWFIVDILSFLYDWVIMDIISFVYDNFVRNKNGEEDLNNHSIQLFLILSILGAIRMTILFLVFPFINVEISNFILITVRLRITFSILRFLFMIPFQYLRNFVRITKIFNKILKRN